MYDELFASNPPTLTMLRSFLEVATSGGYAAAADHDLSRAANLKNRVGSLDDIFHGSPLFQKRGRGVELTAKGQELRLIASQVLQLLNDFKQSCKEEQSLVRIGGGQSIFDEIFVSRWAKIRSQMRKIRFQFSNLRTDETIKQLREQRIDFGVVRSSAKDMDGLEAHPLRKLEFALYVPRALLKLPSDPQSLVELKGEKLPVATLAGDGEFRKRLDGFGKKYGIKFQYVMECTSQSQVRSFLATKTLAAVLPEVLGVDDDEVAKFAGDEFADFSRKVSLVWLPGRLKAVDSLEVVRGGLVKLLADGTSPGSSKRPIPS